MTVSWACVHAFLMWTATFKFERPQKFVLKFSLFKVQIYLFSFLSQDYRQFYQFEGCGTTKDSIKRVKKEQKTPEFSFSELEPWKLLLPTKHKHSLQERKFLVGRRSCSDFCLQLSWLLHDMDCTWGPSYRQCYAHTLVRWTVPVKSVFEKQRKIQDTMCRGFSQTLQTQSSICHLWWPDRLASFVFFTNTNCQRLCTQAEYE